MAEDSEDVSRNSGNNRRTQCGPDNDDQTPAVNTGVQTSAVNAGLQTPAVNARLQTPAVNAGLQTSAVNAGLQTPAVNAGLQTSAVNAGLQTPAVNAGLQTPAVHATLNVNMSKQLETQLSAVSSHDRSVLLYLCLFNSIPITLKAARTVYQPFQA